MRPLELRLRNFRSYFGDDAVFDFRGRRLIGIVGPIGSGKSSLLDAIAFALYGRTPRVARATKTLIHQRAEAAAVSLRFEVDGQTWEAVRSIRAKGASQHALYRYEEDTTDAEPVEKIVQEADVNARIMELLGFDFDAFGRSVMLAQGQFAEFLNARPAERDKVLKGVFGHERIDTMRELAKDHVRTAEFEIDKLGLRLEQADQAMARLMERRRDWEAAEARRAALEKHEPQVVDLNERHLEVSRTARVAADRLQELQDHARRMPDPAATDELLSHAVAARQQRVLLAKELETAHARVQRTEADVQSDENVQRRERLAAAKEALHERALRVRELDLTVEQVDAARMRVQRAEDEAAAATDRLEAAAGLVTTATSNAAEATARLEAAEQALHEAVHTDMAATLRRGLHTGDACPVCHQPVPELDDAAGPVAVAEAEAAAAAARAAAQVAQQALSDARARHQAAQRALADATRRVADARRDLTLIEQTAAIARETLRTVDERLREMLGEGPPEPAVAELEQAIEALQAAVDAARVHLEELRRRHDAAIAAEQDTDRALGDLRARLGALAGLLDSEAEPPDDDPAVLRLALDDLRLRWGEAIATAQATLTGAQEELASIEAELAAIFEELDISGSFDAARGEAETAVTLLAQAIETDQKLVDDARELRSARSGQIERLELMKRLATDLTDSRFIRYLLDEERAVLAELGSGHFQRLSSGRYRFTEDGAFEVVDLTAADAVRKADSLSGGETFLASLALALGLAEMVSRTGGRLEAFLLDEGFGSLDPEHLDLAMEGIEQLVGAGSDRLVVVVSHVPEMRQRLEDLIVLDRNPTTGDSIVVAGASL